MPAFSIDRDQAVREIAAVERALEEGHPAPGMPQGTNTLKGALRVANERLGLGTDYNILKRRVGTPSVPGSIFRRFQLAVDWAKYKPRPEPEPAPAPPVEPPGPSADPIELRRLRAPAHPH